MTYKVNGCCRTCRRRWVSVQSATEVLVMFVGKHSILHEEGGRHLCGTAKDKKTSETREMRQDSKEEGCWGQV